MADITLNWSSVSKASQYKVWKKETSGDWQEVTTTNKTSYKVTGLTEPLSKWTLAVSALCNGIESEKAMYPLQDTPATSVPCTDDVTPPVLVTMSQSNGQLYLQGPNSNGTVLYARRPDGGWDWVTTIGHVLSTSGVTTYGGSFSGIRFGATVVMDKITYGVAHLRVLPWPANGQPLVVENLTCPIDESTPCLVQFPTYDRLLNTSNRIYPGITYQVK
jgi:hypothetical protein